MADQILPQGIRCFNKGDKAPDFVIGTLVITPDDLMAFTIDHPELMTQYNGKDQLKLQILRSKKGDLYCAVDTYKPASSPTAAPGPNVELPDISQDLPF